MRYATPLLVFSWPPAPEARVGPAYAITAPGRPRIEAVRVPYPFRRVQPGRPLEREEGPRLFEAVAELEVGAPEAVAAFARSWGLLLRDTPWLSLEARPSKGAPVRWAGQSLDTWQIAVDELREARELWRAISEGDAPAMEKVVSIRQRGGRTVAFYQGMRGWFEVALPRRSLTDAARAVLAELVSQREDAPLGVGYDRTRPRRLRRIARPRSLIAAAWSQLADYVSRDEARSCPRCGRIFVVELEVGGRRADHCSDACRIAMHRRRAKMRAGRA